jgi:solute carrier family 25 folate transporter 32
VAGVSGGVAATVLLHPLDLLKIRFAVNDGQNAAGRPTYAGMKNAVANIGTAGLELSCFFRIALL